MELKWIEDFINLAQTGNFSKSAAQRNVSQSAFSRRIRSLELWLGAPLVDRSTYPTSLTAEGEAFRETAEELVRRLYEERDHIRGIHGRSRDAIVFSAMHTVSLTFFPRWLRSLEQHLDGIETRLSAENMHDGVRMLVEGHSDFFICMTHPAIPLNIDILQYPSVKLGDERLLPMSAPASGGQPLLKLPGTAGKPIPFLDYAPASYLGRAVDLLLDKRKSKPHLRRCYENSMAESLKMMALEGHGLAWLPESSIRREIDDATLVRAGGEDWDVALEIRIYRAGDRIRPKAEKLWSLLAGDAPQGITMQISHNR